MGITRTTTELGLSAGIRTGSLLDEWTFSQRCVSLVFTLQANIHVEILR